MESGIRAKEESDHKISEEETGQPEQPSILVSIKEEEGPAEATNSGGVSEEVLKEVYLLEQAGEAKCVGDQPVREEDTQSSVCPGVESENPSQDEGGG